MIPVSVSDIIKLLEQIPIWKKVVQATKDVEDLKVRVAALEALAQKPPSVVDGCPICETGQMKVTASAPHRQLGRLGVQERTVACNNPACSHAETRLHDPNGVMGGKKR